MTFPKQPPSGFQGLHNDLAVEIYHRYLPHWRQEGATYFVTLHLNDSLPQVALRALQMKREAFDQAHPPPHSDATVLARAQLLAAEEERWLDQGYGACPFRDPEHRAQLAGDMNYFDNQGTGKTRYRLGAWVIMPNHVHALIQPNDQFGNSLEYILKGWKVRSAKRINAEREQEGSRWFHESYDRIVRDPEHLWRCLQYIGMNGAKAGVKECEFDRWVSPEWVEQGWGFAS